MNPQDKQKMYSIVSKFATVAPTFLLSYYMIKNALPAFKRIYLPIEDALHKGIFGTYTENPKPLYIISYAISTSVLSAYLHSRLFSCILDQIPQTNKDDAETMNESEEQLANQERNIVLHQALKPMTTLQNNLANSLSGLSIGMFYTVYKRKTDINYSLPSSRGIFSFIERHPIPCSLLLSTPLLIMCIHEYNAEQKQRDEVLDDHAPEATNRS